MSPARLAWIALVALSSAPLVAQTLPDLRLVAGGNANESFGLAIAGGADFDGDGVPDLLVGAPFDDNVGLDSGSARIVSGATGAFLHTVNGSAGDDRCGQSVAILDDVDGDGTRDFAVGVYLSDLGGTNAGRIRVHSGATGALIYALNGSAPFDWFGYCLAAIGDVDLDGKSDLAVGAPFGDLGAPDGGYVRVISGATGTILYDILGTVSFAQFGVSCAATGDLNGDGIPDLAIGAPGDGIGVPSSGVVRVYSGLQGAALYAIGGAASFDSFGQALAGLGDVNGDGVPDLLIGAPFADPAGNASGAASVHSGVNGALIRSHPGQSAGERFGAAVAAAGDVDGDGRMDVAIGAPRSQAAGIDSGRVRVHSGASGALIATVDGADAGDQFGSALAAAGDLNGDGFGDLAIGAPADELSGGNSGSVLVRALNGAERYGTGTGLFDLGFVPGTPPATLRQGFIHATGGSPFGSGLIAASLAPDAFSIGQPAIPIWIDVNAPAFILSTFVPLSPSGNFTYFINLQQPIIAGTVLHLQLFDLSNFPVKATNGLALLFAS